MEPTPGAPSRAPAQGAAASEALTAELLVERYGGMVYNLALRLTGRPTDAEDLAQDALIRAVKALGRFQGRSDPGTWLYRITVNTWKNRVRSEKRRKLLSWFWPASEEEDEAPREPAEDAPPLDSNVEKAEEQKALEAALASLDPEDRAILALRELDGRSYGEIADALGVPVGTVKSRIFRARDALRAKLKPYLHGT